MSVRHGRLLYSWRKSRRRRWRRRWMCGGWRQLHAGLVGWTQAWNGDGDRNQDQRQQLKARCQASRVEGRIGCRVVGDRRDECG